MVYDTAKYQNESGMITPKELLTELPITPQCLTTITRARQEIVDILHKKDDRLVVIVGPCSIHDTNSALLYAEKLRKKIDAHRDTLCIVMRAYIEKSRTAIGWKGLVNDPSLNDTFSIKEGLHIARSTLLAINELQVPVAAEMVSPFTAPYFVDLLSWAAIGARTTESQLHRELASDLPLPVGFKNNTSGDVQVAIDAITTAKQSHHFLGLNDYGNIAIRKSSGNKNCHVVLRGSHRQSNYDIPTIQNTIKSLKKARLTPRIMIDCSHDNSQKNHLVQLHVLHILAKRIEQNDQTFFGVMIESHLKAGKQRWTPHQSLIDGQSITDACLGWEDTEVALGQLSIVVQKRRKNVLDYV